MDATKNEKLNAVSLLTNILVSFSGAWILKKSRNVIVSMLHQSNWISLSRLFIVFSFITGALPWAVHDTGSIDQMKLSHKTGSNRYSSHLPHVDLTNIAGW